MEKVAIGPNGERTIYRLAEDESGQQYWKALPQEAPDTTLGTAYGIMAKKMQDIGNILQDQRASADRLREQDVKAMPLLDRTLIDAGQQTAGFGTGIKSLGKKLNAFGEYITPGGASGIESMQDAMAYDNELEQQRKLMREFNENKGAGVVGGMLPYILTSVGGGPIARGVAERTTGAVADIAKEVGTQSKSLLAKGARGMAASDIPVVSNIGKKAVTEYVEPIEKWAIRQKLKSPMESPYRQGALSDILGSTMLGATEGLLNSNLDVKSGALAGLSGGTAGRALKYYVERAPRPTDESYNEALQRRIDRGHVALPGEVLDDAVKQAEESAMRGHTKYSPFMREHDNANQRVTNRDAYMAMGVTDGRTSMTPAQIGQHVDATRQAYQDLEAKTATRLEHADINNLKQHTLGLAGASSDDAISASKLANEYLKKFTDLRKQQQVTRNATNGRMQGATAPGGNWQDLRSELKADISNAYDKGNWRAANALKPFLSTLDRSVENGLRKLGKAPGEGDALVNQWKDLNEQYAMGKILMTKGMDGFGNVQPDKLYNHFMNTERENLLQNKAGARKQTLFDIAKLTPIDKRQAGSLLTGMNEVGKQEPRTQRQIFMSTPAAMVPGPLSEAYFRMYRAGIPNVTGLSGLVAPGGWNGKGLKNTGVYTRSAAQSTQLTPSIVNAIEEALKGTYDFAQHPLDTTRDWWKKDNK